MKRLIRFSVLALSLIALVLLVAGPVAAKATKKYFTGCEYDTEIIYGDEWTYPGPNMHLRGRIHPFYDVVPDEERVVRGLGVAVQALGLPGRIAPAGVGARVAATAHGVRGLSQEGALRVGPLVVPEVALAARGRRRPGVGAVVVVAARARDGPAALGLGPVVPAVRTKTKVGRKAPNDSRLLRLMKRKFLMSGKA